jgi:HEPN domain-containing protein
LVDQAKALDKHYITTRYPNGFERGAPMDYYTRSEAERSVEYAKDIIHFCESLLAESGSGDDKAADGCDSDEGGASGN